MERLDDHVAEPGDAEQSEQQRGEEDHEAGLTGEPHRLLQALGRGDDPHPADQLAPQDRSPGHTGAGFAMRPRGRSIRSGMLDDHRAAQDRREDLDQVPVLDLALLDQRGVLGRAARGRRMDFEPQVGEPGRGGGDGAVGAVDRGPHQVGLGVRARDLAREPGVVLGEERGQAALGEQARDRTAARLELLVEPAAGRGDEEDLEADAYAGEAHHHDQQHPEAQPRGDAPQWLGNDHAASRSVGAVHGRQPRVGLRRAGAGPAYPDILMAPR